MTPRCSPAAASRTNRGTSRRIIGKHSRHEVRERARRLLPLAFVDESEAAARPGREAARDARLARMLGTRLRLGQ